MHPIKQHILHILSVYNGEIPLAHFLKAYFKQHTRLGSRDRKSISEALYGYYRLSRFFPDLPAESLICSGLQDGLIRHPFLHRVFEITPDPANESAGLPASFIADRKARIHAAIRRFNTLLPLSGDLTKAEWAETLLEQRALFVRIRKNEKRTMTQLEKADIPFFTVSREAQNAQTCLVLENSLALDKYLVPEAYVIQDYAVQTAVLQTAAHCRQMFKDISSLRVWDTCAGAGGKTLYWKDLFPAHPILATDRRASILHNLRQRARLYGIGDVRTKTLDLTRTDQVQTVQQQFDLVLCDVPCSGSGTWGRTPEQFHFADTETICNFPELQYRIVSRAVPKLCPGGLLAYITCSAFKAENEAVAERITSTLPVNLIHQELIRSADVKSDIIYLALFRKDAPVERS